VKEFRPEYAAGGCKYSDLLKLQALENEAAEASKVAERTAANATVVQKELARAQEALASLHIDLTGFEEDIVTARGLILAQSPEAADVLSRLEHLANEYRAVRAQAMGLVRVLHPAWNDEPRSPAKSVEGANVVYECLERANIESFDREREKVRSRDWSDKTNREQEWLKQLTAPWLELLRDLDAN